MTPIAPPQRFATRRAIVGEDTPIARALPQRARRSVGAHPHIGLQTFTECGAPQRLALSEPPESVKARRGPQPMAGPPLTRTATQHWRFLVAPCGRAAGRPAAALHSLARPPAFLRERALHRAGQRLAESANRCGAPH